MMASLGAHAPSSATGVGVVAVVLAAGYGTRLEADLRGEGSAASLALVGVPKPLLPVRAGAPLLDEWMHAFLVRSRPRRPGRNSRYAPHSPSLGVRVCV
jgi:hypothetical protein